MALVHPQSSGRPDDLIGRLVWRNRIVAALRVVVPLVGALLFLLLVGQIWLANMMRQYGVAGITIDRGHLVVDTPQYTVTGPGGARYLVSAREARAALDNPDLIELADATLDYARPNRPAILAAAEIANLDSGRQTVDVPGTLTISSEDGLEGTLDLAHADLNAQTMNADGAVAIKLPDGTTIDAANMVFDGNTQVWTFGQATVVIPDLPEGEE